MARCPRAFTLLEIIMVVVIISVATGLALAGYWKTFEKSREDEAWASLRTIHAAEKLYFANNNIYWPTNSSVNNVADINTNLKLSIVEDGVTYQCISPTGNGATFQCTATRAGAYLIQVNQDVLSGTNPVKTIL